MQKEIKQEIIAKYATHEGDTGSPEVQVAVLTYRINTLTEHLKANKKDHSSRYGLLRKVQNRRNLLNYLKRENEQSYRDLLHQLGSLDTLCDLPRRHILTYNDTPPIGFQPRIFFLMCFWG